MQTFVNLREAAQWQNSATAIIFSGGRSEWTNANEISFPMFPLTKKIQSIFEFSKEATTYHVTDLAGAEHVINNQNNKRIQLSVMTRFDQDSNPITGGIWHKGVGMILHGTLLSPGAGDIQSVPDNSGIRWISWNMYAREGAIDTENILTKINDIFKRNILTHFYPSFYKEYAEYIRNNDLDNDIMSELMKISDEEQYEWFQNILKWSDDEEETLSGGLFGLSERTDMDISEVKMFNMALFSSLYIGEFVPKQLLQKYAEIYITTVEKSLMPFKERIQNVMLANHSVTEGDRYYAEGILTDYVVDYVLIADTYTDKRSKKDILRLESQLRSEGINFKTSDDTDEMNKIQDIIANDIY